MLCEASLHGLKRRRGWGGRSPPPPTVCEHIASVVGFLLPLLSGLRALCLRSPFAQFPVPLRVSVPSVVGLLGPIVGSSGLLPYFLLILLWIFFVPVVGSSGQSLWGLLLAYASKPSPPPPQSPKYETTHEPLQSQTMNPKP